LFGSVNLDPRSFRRDLDITLAVYDTHTCRALARFADNTARLIGPLL
jgi:phosphatidylserine/phosphatidylglycerophosphate/cardiolipin synthase-like enzyme